MAIRRVDGDETDDQRETREADEAAVKARQEKEDAREARIRELELESARNASALEESRRHRETENQPPAGPTEDQWQSLEAMPENAGKTRQQIQAEANKMAAIADARMKPLNERASAAEERAAKAEERAARLEARRSLDKVEDRFYKQNAALEPHKAEVEAFLAEFPDQDKVDAKTYEKRLTLAADYVKGKVKTLRSEPRRGEFTSRSVEHEEGDERDGEFDGRFDPKGTGGNRGAIQLMEGVAANFGRDTKHEDSVEVWKKSRDEEDRGVSIDSSEEVSHARRVLARGSNLGGKRGEI